MKKQIIFSGEGARILSENEMRHVYAGVFKQDNFGWLNGRDLTACNNKKCTRTSDCGNGFCASMTCNNVTEKHCM